ncbi:MAG: 50S ribosomal protein L18e [Candidatus Aenigmarchaeota archaeon]|nr:50S ribosomal protein L18e [Candidatus Aenigmarchaeota archaeon]
MAKHTGPTNPLLKKLIDDLRKKSFETNSKFLKDISEKLNKPRRQRVEVNLSKIDRYAKKGETVIIPGVVMGFGELTKPITISAWKFTGPSREKIEQLKGKAITIEELVAKNPKGTKVRIMC